MRGVFRIPAAPVVTDGDETSPTAGFTLGREQVTQRCKLGNRRSLDILEWVLRLWLVAAMVRNRGRRVTSTLYWIVFRNHVTLLEHVKVKELS